jgi:hypothetical protein
MKEVLMQPHEGAAAAEKSADKNLLDPLKTATRLARRIQSSIVLNINVE